MQDITMHLAAIVAAIVILCTVLLLLRKRSKSKLPPGPIGLPILGYLPFLGSDIYDTLDQLSKKYGDILSLKMGSKQVVFLNSAESIRQAFSSSNLSGRPEEVISLFGYESPLLTKNGGMWKEHRRFVNRTLPELGLTIQSRLTDYTEDEMNRFVDILLKKNCKAFDPTEEIYQSIGRVTAMFLYGEVQDSDAEFVELSTRLHTETQSQMRLLLTMYFPWTTKIPFFGKKILQPRILKHVAEYSMRTRGKIEKHKRTLNPTDIRDFTDSYLVELGDKSRENKDTTFSESALDVLLIGLYGGAVQTQVQALRWCLYVLAVYKDYQEKIQKEIDGLIGRERIPNFLDERHMPLTVSSIMEVLRWRFSSSLNFPRQTMADTKVGRYVIPKGCIVLANFRVALKSPAYWTNPLEFYPERFLSDDGASIVKNDNFIPFSFGSRSCPGDAYTMTLLFLYVASVFQKFDVRIEDGRLPDLEPVKGSLTPDVKPYKLIFTPRK